MQLNKTYKLRHAVKQRRRWEAAALLKNKDLSVWMRDAADEQANTDLSEPAQ